LNKQLIIDIFTVNSLNDLPDLSQYVKLCKQNINNPIFNAFCIKIFQEKKYFEERVITKINVRNRLYESFILLSQRQINNQSEEFEIQKFFVKKLVLPDCSEEQNIYFEKIIDIFCRCSNDYFLSFTGKKPNQQEVNMIHINYKHFIKLILFIKNYDKYVRDAESNGHNLLAQAINKLISEKLHGFYYPYHQGDNDITIKKLREGCASAFTFIQIIQDIIFNYDEERTNYCHLEYEQILTHVPSERRFFILAEQNRNNIRGKDHLYPKYEKWYDEFNSKDPIHLRPSIQYNQAEIIFAKNLIEHKLVNSIITLRDKLFNGIPI